MYAIFTKTYEGQPLLRGVSFRVDQGETVCLLGPSGSGKSTLLRLIAGLEQPEEGQILLGWTGPGRRTRTPAAVRLDVPGLRPFSPPQCA